MLHDKTARSSQIGAFDTAVVAELVKQIQEIRPEFVQAIPEVILEEMAIGGLERARQRGFYDAMGSMGYVILMFEVGANFDQVEPVASLLKDKDIAAHQRWGFLVNNIAAEQWHQIAIQRDDRYWYPELLHNKQKSYFLDSTMPEGLERFIEQGEKELSIYQDLLSEELALASIDVQEQEKDTLTLAIQHFQRGRGDNALAAGGALLEVVPRILDWWMDAGKRESTFMRIMALKKAIITIACKLIGLQVMKEHNMGERLGQVMENIQRVISDKALQTLPIALENNKFLPAQTHNGQKRPSMAHVLDEHHVSLVTGELLLDLEDFHISGPIPLHWRRFYSSSDTENVGNGPGWRYTASACIQVQFNQAVLFDEDGRIIYFDMPQPNQGSKHSLENMVLWRDEQENFHLNRGEFTDIFTGGGLFKYVSARVDRNGNEIRFQRDKEGRIQTMTDSCGRQYAMAYNTDGLVAAISMCDERGTPQLPALVYYQYDDQKRLMQAIDALGQNERYQYQGNLINKRTLKSGYAYNYEWDGENCFSRCRRVIGQTGIHERRFIYSTLNRQTQVKSLGGTQTYHYNEAGLLTAYVESDGRKTQYHYDHHYRLKHVEDAAGQKLTCHYNIFGQLVSVKNPIGGVTRFVYDEAQQPIRMVDAGGGTWLREYDAKGNVTAVVNPLGYRTELHYDVSGLLVGLIESSGKHHHLVWQDGQLTEYKDASGRHTQYRHDNLGRITNITDWVGLETKFEYDLTGRIIRIALCDGGEKIFKYDALGNLVVYKDEKGNSTQYVYHGLRQPLQRIGHDGSWVYYDYDNERRLIQLRHEHGDHYQISHDQLGRIKRVTINGEEQLFEYDDLDHLVAWRHAYLTWRLTRNGLGALLSMENEAGIKGRYTYDPVGRMTSAEFDGQRRRFLFDSGGQLLEEQCDDLILRYEYDSAGQRVKTYKPDGEVIKCVFDEVGVLNSVDGQPVYQYKQAEEMPVFPRVEFSPPMPEVEVDPMAVKSLGWISENVPFAYHILKPAMDMYHNFQTGADLFQYHPFQVIDQVAGRHPAILNQDPACEVYRQFDLDGQLDPESIVEHLREIYLSKKDCNLIMFNRHNQE